MRRYIALFLALCLAFLLIGCSAEYDSASSESVYNTTAAEAPAMEEMGFDEGTMDYAAEESYSPESVEVERMIIKNANIDMATNDFDSALSGIRGKISELSGEVTGSDQWGSEEYSDRYITLTVRIPAENYQSFIDGVSEIGEVMGLHESSEDVTTQYIDLEARIESLEAQEDRLLELLEIAETVTEIMEIETHLSNVRYERESYTQQRLYLERQVSMSTIYISLQEQEQIIITERSFFSDIASSFVNGFFGLGDFLSGFMIFFVGAIPTLVLLGAIAAVVIVIIRKIRKKRK